MDHQLQASKVENVVLSALDPKSTSVYYLANGGIILLIIVLIILYVILQSYHLLIMMCLALGLLGSVNFVWMNRIDPDQIKDENNKSNTSKTSKNNTTRKRPKRTRKE